MNAVNAQILMDAMRVVAEAMSHGADTTVRLTCHGVTCAYYPTSRRYAWFQADERNVTQGIPQKQAVTLLSAALADSR